MNKQFTEKEKDALSSLKLRRVILPIFIGVAVVFYLLYKQFDPEAFRNIEWDSHLLFWVVMAVIVMAGHHLAYSYRLRVLSGKQFSWWKSIELIFIWEFSSAVSPTSVGGSAVALFVLSQEKLRTARVGAIVLYTVVLDSLYFLLAMPILILIYGPSIIRPGMETLSFATMDGWAYAFFGSYIFMFFYALLFFYGLFINPLSVKRLLVFFTRFGFLRRFRRSAVELGNDFIVSSGETKDMPLSYHISAFIMTVIAWSGRFLVLNCLIIAFVDTTPLDFWSQGYLFSRVAAMFLIILFSPTPGGAGFVEVLFTKSLTDIVRHIPIIVVTVWRIITYYGYLLAGAFIIPNWIDKIMKRRKKNREAQ